MPQILIADDDAANRYLLETILKGQGYRTVSAANGAEALRLAQDGAFGLIITDILMPVMDGFNLCRAWQQDPRLARIPFIFYTATYIEARDEAFALSLGADRFLVKPQPPEVILRAIQDLLGREAEPRPGAPLEEARFVREHNLALFRKLEAKMAALDRLQVSHARLGQILAASTNEIFVFDGATLRFTLVNRGALDHLGYTEAELLGLTPADLCRFDREAFNALTGPLRAGLRDSVAVKTELRAKSGASYPVAVHLEPILDGNELSFLAVVQDITEQRAQAGAQRRLEAQLHHLQRLESLGRMASNVAHDLNNLLAPILALAGALQARFGETPELGSALGTILLAAERGRDLVGGLTDFARKGIQSAVPVDLNALVAQAVALLGADAGAAVQWQPELAAGLPPVLGDAAALLRVLLNLGRNASDAMKGQGRIRIQTRLLRPHWVELTVTDTGCGIPLDQLAQVLEPFFTTKAAGQGTGLGLAIVNAIVRAHAGHLVMDSQEGQGTCVRIELPAQ